MNLTKLFETQRVLDEHIYDKHPELRGQDNLDWKILALQVELAECANEWRGFKKWSNDQEPRTKRKVMCHACRGLGEHYQQVFHGVEHVEDKRDICLYCNGTGWQEDRNPLLDEYVDFLHFIFSIGLELKQSLPQGIMQSLHFTPYNESITTLFIEVNNYLLNFYMDSTKIRYARTLQSLLGLGATLGFTWEQVETAYFAKNRVNHERQENDY